VRPSRGTIAAGLIVAGGGWLLLVSSLTFVSFSGSGCPTMVPGPAAPPPYCVQAAAASAWSITLSSVLLGLGLSTLVSQNPKINRACYAAVVPLVVGILAMLVDVGSLTFLAPLPLVEVIIATLTLPGLCLATIGAGLGLASTGGRASAGPVHESTS
jgi:hypothetical protein